MTEQALSDVKVLDLTHYVAGPYCTKLLADYGADVIKVERPGVGDGARRYGPFYHDEPHPEGSALFLHLNTNKKSLTLNLKSALGRKIVLELAKRSDVVVEAFAPRTMPALGLGYETLRQANPKLIMTSISNFGQSGPYRDFKGSELVLFGIGGDLARTGVPDREPVKLVSHAAQFMTGMVAASATMGALMGQRVHGLAQQVDISMVQVQANGTERRRPYALSYQYDKLLKGREYASAASGYPGGCYPCKDGYFQIGGGVRYWPRVVRMMGSPPGLLDPKWTAPLAQDSPELKEEFLNNFFYPWLAEHTMMECWEASQVEGMFTAPLATVSDLLKDPHLAARQYWEEIDHPQTGKATYPGVPFRMGETPAAPRRPAPLLGQHNAEVMGDLGYAKEDLVRMREMGVI